MSKNLTALLSLLSSLCITSLTYGQEVVCLTTNAMPYAKSDDGSYLPNLFVRELVRQSFLMAARDMGAATRGKSNLIFKTYKRNVSNTNS